MKIFSQIIAILVVSFIVGLVFNTFSLHGIDIFDNSWSKHSSGAPAFKDEHNSELVQDESTIFVGFDRACQFVEDQEGQYWMPGLQRHMLKDTFLEYTCSFFTI